jgi:hypothetical protein
MHAWKPLGRPRRRWEDSINVHHRDAGCWNLNCIVCPVTIFKIIGFELCGSVTRKLV